MIEQKEKGLLQARAIHQKYRSSLYKVHETSDARERVKYRIDSSLNDLFNIILVEDHLGNEGVIKCAPKDIRLGR